MVSSPGGRELRLLSGREVTMLKCDDCGRFMSEAGSTWAEIYDFAAMCLDRTHHRCKRCTEKLGPAKSNAKPCSGDMTPYEGVNA